MSAKVLFVDDDPNILSAFRRRLRREFPVDIATSGGEGLAVLRERGPFAVVVADYCMPCMNGIEFLARARRTAPETVRMLLTGSADLNAAIQAVNQSNIYQFLTKPCPGDELRRALRAGVAEYRRVHRERKYNKRARRQLAEAREVQCGLMPCGEGRIEGLEIAGRSIFLDQTGGDYYDYFRKPAGGGAVIVVAVGDVSDHGPASALLMASARAFIRECALQPGSAAEIVGRVNLRLCRDIQATGRFMTLFYAEIDLGQRCLRWVRAGHPPALVFDRSGGDFTELRGMGGLPLGVFDGAGYEEHRQAIQPGEIIAIGTDGVLDACDSSGRAVGGFLLKRVLGECGELPAAEIVSRVLGGLQQQIHPAALHDDSTLVVVKVEG